MVSEGLRAAAARPQPGPLPRHALCLCPSAQRTSENSQRAWDGHAHSCFLLLVGWFSSTANRKAEPAGTAAGPSVCHVAGWGRLPTSSWKPGKPKGGAGVQRDQLWPRVWKGQGGGRRALGLSRLTCSHGMKRRLKYWLFKFIFLWFHLSMRLIGSYLDWKWKSHLVLCLQI